MGLRDKLRNVLKDSGLVEDDGESEIIEDPESQPTPEPARTTPTNKYTRTATSARPTVAAPISGLVSAFDQHVYDVLVGEVHRGAPDFAGFVQSLESPMAKRIPSEKDRYQASAETLNITREKVLAAIDRAEATLTSEIEEYTQTLEGQKAQQILPRQEKLTNAQREIGTLQKAIEQTGTDLEATIARLREEAATKIDGLRSRIREQEASISPLQTEIDSVELKNRSDLATFTTSANKLGEELRRIRSQAEQFLIA